MMLLLLLSAVILINCLFYFLFSKFSMAKAPKSYAHTDFPVSVIICAKNESDNLRRFIPMILEQEHSNFELIIINDASSDETQEVIEEFMQIDSRVKTVEVANNEAFWSNKKYSLTLGIKKAQHPRLLFTDADCYPASKQWLSLMTRYLSDTKQLVLGYGAYEKEKGLLNKMVRFETALTAIQYFSYANVGIPYMGVGRNLAYTSQLFYQHSGFMSHMKIPSGDDDLFVNEAATANNIVVMDQPEAFTYSIPKKTWKSWKIQKKRHITTSKYYRPIHKMLLGLYYFANLLFWIISILAFIFLDWKLPLALVVFRFVLQYVFLSGGFKKLQEKDLLPWIPLFELFLVFFQLTIFSSNTISKPKRWK